MVKESVFIIEFSVLKRKDTNIWFIYTNIILENFRREESENQTIDMNLIKDTKE